MRNLALFLDGTWNTTRDNTNVWRMKSISQRDDEQLIYYSKGVGTQLGTKVLGGMLGFGLEGEVVAAYEWLIDNYHEGDRIYLFGFSRGAFTARSLAGLIAKCGLIKKGSPLSTNQLYMRYKTKPNLKSIRQLRSYVNDPLTIEDKWMIEYSAPIPIWFIGVWDTVGALGIPFGNVPGVSRSTYGFLKTNIWQCQDRAFHALSLDEHRLAFFPTFWTKLYNEPDAWKTDDKARPFMQVEQRWFIGAHSDVGGGYADDTLAQIPMQWIMRKAKAHGLRLDDMREIDSCALLGRVHDSFSEMAWGYYKLARLNNRYYRVIGSPAIKTKDGYFKRINESIDVSVFRRYQIDSSYRPENLTLWAQRVRIDLSKQSASLSVDTLEPLG